MTQYVSGDVEIKSFTEYVSLSLATTSLFYLFAILLVTIGYDLEFVMDKIEEILLNSQYIKGKQLISYF